MTDLLNFINMHANAERNGTLTIKMDDSFIVVSTVNGIANYENSYCKLDNYFTRDSHKFELVIPYGNLNKEGKSLTDGDDLIVVKTVKDFPEVYMKTIWDLEVSVRSKNCLRAENLYYLGDVIQKTEYDMRITPNLGLKSLKEIKEELARFDLKLDTVDGAWPPIDLPERNTHELFS